jgi:hypothetical protein
MAILAVPSIEQQKSQICAKMPVVFARRVICSTI